MSRYEFLFVVTEVELSDQQWPRVGRAAAMAGEAELAAAVPADAVSGPLALDERLGSYWCGIPG